MVDTAKENTSPTGHCHSPLTRDTSSLSASAVFALLHAHPDASRSRAGRETSNAPPALVVQRINPSEGAAASVASTLPPARTDASSSRAGREPSSAPPAFVGRRSSPFHGAAARAASALVPTPSDVSRSRAGRLRSAAHTPRRKQQPR
jgi:hypothetical protein